MGCQVEKFFIKGQLCWAILSLQSLRSQLEGYPAIRFGESLCFPQLLLAMIPARGTGTAVWMHRKDGELTLCWHGSHTDRLWLILACSDSCSSLLPASHTLSHPPPHPTHLQPSWRENQVPPGSPSWFFLTCSSLIMTAGRLLAHSKNPHNLSLNWTFLYWVKHPTMLSTNSNFLWPF